MAQPPLADAARPAESWAEVRAHDQVIRYRRSGVGRAVVLALRPGDGPEPLWSELLDTLSSGFRLIVPEPPPAGADVANWLADFLEGLGVSNVGILARDDFCVPVLELTLLGSDQVRRIVLVLDCEERGELGSAMSQAAVPLLVIDPGQPAAEIVPLVTGFLSPGPK